MVPDIHDTTRIEENIITVIRERAMAHIHSDITISDPDTGQLLIKFTVRARD